jgi:prophage regulatory protein
MASCEKNYHAILRRRCVMEKGELVDARELEALTGTRASTWRYWAYNGCGPASFKLGKRRVWLKSDVLAWIADQRAATAVAAVNRLGHSDLIPAVLAEVMQR